MTPTTTTNNLSTLIGVIAGYLDKILLLLMGIAVLMFVFYVIRYFIQPNDKRSEAAQYLMWSLIGFVVILSFWGIVNIVIATFGFGSTNSPGTWANLSQIFPN